MHEDIEAKPVRPSWALMDDHEIDIYKHIEEKLDAFEQRLSCLEKVFGTIGCRKSQNVSSGPDLESKIDRQIFQVIDNMDFDRIHSVMELLDWQWIFGGRARVPSAEEIRRRAIDLLEDVKKKLSKQEFDGDSREFSISTGGLHASIEEWKDGNCWVYLEFILEDHEAGSWD